MQKIFVFAALFFAFGGKAQITTSFRYSNNQQAEEIDTIRVQITNGYAQGIDIKIGEAYVSFGDTVFKPMDSVLNVQAGSTETLNVLCYSRHNLNHAYALPLEIGGYGTYGIQLYNNVSYAMSRYNGTQGKTGEALKSALKSAAQQGQNSLGYNTARDRMYGNIDNENGDVTCAYTGRTATFNTRAGANSNNFNCEHTFPQGFFNSNEPMKSDIFHLFPTDVTANSQRGNLPFGLVSNPSWSVGGSKKSSSAFEPRDAQKGKTARAMMYFVIRYQDYSNHFAGQENILRTWNENFPVDASEAQRNDDIAQYQGNRNPFIDYPQFAERFTSFTSNGDLPSVSLAELSDDSLALSQGTSGYVFFRNKGTETINITDVQLSNPSAFASDTLGDPELLAGEGVLIKVDFLTTGQAESGTLTLQTDDAVGSYRVQLVSEGASGVKVSEENRAVSLFPNPAEDMLFANEALTDVIILDIRGVVVNQSAAKKNFWNIAHLPAGFYYFKGLSSSGELKTAIFLVR
jgi:endonuclease I